MPLVQLSLLWHLVLSWMITWITTVPLFHIPDTTDTWAVLASGGAHTFTPDLPAEFSYGAHAVDEKHSQLDQRLVNSSELGFVICKSDGDKQKAICIAASWPFRTPRPYDIVFAYPQTNAQPPLSDASHTCRAPPFRLVV